MPRNSKKGKGPKIKGRELGRRKAARTSGKTVLIVCEDSKSSCDYFKKFRSKLRLATINVQICGSQCGSAPINVVDYAIQKQESSAKSPVLDHYDEIFCVIDKDKHQTLDNAIKLAQKNNIKIILSNPCFEYWYILHYERTSQAFISSAAAVKYLKTKHYQKYTKNSDTIFDDIYDRTDTAISNWKTIRKSHWQNETDLTKCNPSTQVHLVIELLREIFKESTRK